MTRNGVAARVTAYAEPRVEKGDTCPVLKDQLDAQVASASGAIELVIPVGRSTYVTVYCAPGYVSRIEEINANRADGTPIAPSPVELYPQPRAGGDTMARTALAVLDAQLRSRVAGLRTSAAYASAKAQLDPAARHFVQSLEEEATDVPRFVAYYEFEPADSLREVIYFARSTLTYLLNADPAMAAALRRYPHMESFAASVPNGSGARRP